MTIGNGGVIGPANIPTQSAAKGVWSLMEQFIARRQNIWPITSYTVVQTFTATSTWTCPTGVTEVEYLVVAGGGGGGTSGGAGAGGFRTGTGLSVTAGTDYTITVGSGGAGSVAPSTALGSNGGISVFSSITSAGGGGGGSNDISGNGIAGANGGSGGGGSLNSTLWWPRDWEYPKCFT